MKGHTNDVLGSIDTYDPHDIEPVYPISMITGTPWTPSDSVYSRGFLYAGGAAESRDASPNFLDEWLD